MFSQGKRSKPVHRARFTARALSRKKIGFRSAAEVMQCLPSRPTPKRAGRGTKTENPKTPPGICHAQQLCRTVLLAVWLHLWPEETGYPIDLRAFPHRFC